MKKIILSFLLTLIILISSISVLAHQPKIGKESVDVIDPEISKAYYGELKGSPHFYYLNSEQEFSIYLNVLIPGGELTHTVSAELFREQDSKSLALLDGENHEWQEWYEEFGKDYYQKGPELGEDFQSTKKLPPGQYTVKVFNDQNEGKYVLAVGDIESFPPGEISKAVVLVPYLKIFFFDKYYLLIFLFIILLGIIGLIIYRRRKHGQN